MKISTFISLFLVIAGFMFIFALMSDEAKTYYPDANINDSEWAGKYDYSEQINEKMNDSVTAFKNIGDENKGWFVKIVSGIAAIPSAVIGIASLVLGSFGYGAGIITGTLTTLTVPATLIFIIIIMITVWGIMKLIELYQRWQI